VGIAEGMSTTPQESDNDLTLSDDPPIPVGRSEDPDTAEELLTDPEETARKNEFVPEVFG
jgi:hypothetical protein